jgi:hypothetical protein
MWVPPSAERPEAELGHPDRERGGRDGDHPGGAARSRGVEPQRGEASRDQEEEDPERRPPAPRHGVSLGRV